MAELLVIRHGQASFGADNYDQLSELGHRQSRVVGEMLREIGWIPDRLITGTLVRQRETLASMGFGDAAEEHAGFNEYDLDDLFRARFGGAVPDHVKADRKSYFRNLRETVLEWQAGGCGGAKESWQDFATRVEAARRFAVRTDAKRVLVVSSGGVIGRMTAKALDAPDAQMMHLNLQIRNSSMTRFIFSERAFYLQEFNAVPHLMSPEGQMMLTYS
ncbi:histidine phosphatase family protein [Paracoccus methylarcula]|uniref:Histidine phosphatase family protein n=1 Tax=Paracoccus methylarcula TaxID=72022 RepID=A0A422QVF6_9RHOB|nr:histidine phosphatase family protein [Paracoccus methylarcula]RNF33953.1 histidine phosphatase family protein [Paracoccus methylarcula]